MAHLAEEAHTPSQRVTVMLAVHPWKVTSSSDSFTLQAPGRGEAGVRQQPRGVASGGSAPAPSRAGADIPGPRAWVLNPLLCGTVGGAGSAEGRLPAA